MVIVLSLCLFGIIVGVAYWFAREEQKTIRRIPPEEMDEKEGPSHARCWDGVEQFLEGMKMNANDLLNHWFYVTGGTCHLCDPESEAFELMLKNVDGQWQKDRG